MRMYHVVIIISYSEDIHDCVGVIKLHAQKYDRQDSAWGTIHEHYLLQTAVLCYLLHCFSYLNHITTQNIERAAGQRSNCPT